MNRARLIVGVDWATDPRKVGLALADASGRVPRIVEVATGVSGGGTPAEQVARWLDGAASALLAVDAPLGWPAAMGSELRRHQAGEPIAAQPDGLFQRETDRFVRRRVGRRPLEVGADRIARTALAALAFLDELARALSEPVPLAWDPRRRERVSAIEVYPAGTLLAHGITASGYKPADKTQVRREMLAALSRSMALPRDRAPLERQADVLDAAVCVLAGWDFLQGRAMAPSDPNLARKEGWIWVLDPG